MKISETRWRSHSTTDPRNDLLSLLLQEVGVAWKENDPCGEIHASWEEDKVVFTILDGNEDVLSTVRYVVCEEGDHSNEMDC